MKKNVLRVAFSIGAAVIALGTSAYTNAAVSVKYVSQSNGNSNLAADYEYQPSQGCSTPSARNCSFNVTLDAAPALGSHPTQAQVNTAIAGGATGSITPMLKGDIDED